MKTSHKRLAIFLLATVISAIVGTSCRTVRGLGQDVEHAGHHIEHASQH
jgi:predicted small secreted protein